MQGKEYYRRAFICDSLSDYHDRISLRLNRNRIDNGLSSFGHPSQLNIALFSGEGKEEKLIGGLLCSKSVEIYCVPTFKIKVILPFDRKIHGAIAGVYDACNKIDLNVGENIHYGDSKKTECYLMKITELYEKNSRAGDGLAETHLTLEAIKSSYC